VSGTGGTKTLMDSAEEGPAKAGKQPLTDAAKRALAEAEARRSEIDARTKAMPKEEGGRTGPEPVRYGDWEVKGIVSDF